MYLVELFWLEQCFLGKKPAASDKVVLGLLAAVLEVVTVVDTLAVPIPLPRYKLDAALGRMPRQHSIAEVSEDAGSRPPAPWLGASVRAPSPSCIPRSWQRYG